MNEYVNAIVSEKWVYFGCYFLLIAIHLGKGKPFSNTLSFLLVATFHTLLGLKVLFEIPNLLYEKDGSPYWLYVALGVGGSSLFCMASMMKHFTKTGDASKNEEVAPYHSAWTFWYLFYPLTGGFIGFVAGAATMGIGSTGTPSTASNLLYGACVAAGFQASKYLRALADIHSPSASRLESEPPAVAVAIIREQDRLREIISLYKKAIQITARGTKHEEEIDKLLVSIDKEVEVALKRVS